MTFQSLYVEEYESREAACADYVSGQESQMFASLNAYSWLGSPEIFAKERGLPIYYVDNCWCRVAVNAADLREFLKLGVGTELELERLILSVSDERWYVITEEEF